MKKELKPCPFCGAEQEMEGVHCAIRSLTGGQQPPFAVICSCKAQGARAETVAGAVALWNARTSSAAPSPPRHTGEER